MNTRPSLSLVLSLIAIIFSTLALWGLVTRRTAVYVTTMDGATLRQQSVRQAIEVVRFHLEGRKWDKVYVTQAWPSLDMRYVIVWQTNTYELLYVLPDGCKCSLLESENLQPVLDKLSSVL